MKDFSIFVPTNCVFHFKIAELQLESFAMAEIAKENKLNCQIHA